MLRDGEECAELETVEKMTEVWQEAFDLIQARIKEEFPSLTERRDLDRRVREAWRVIRRSKDLK